MTIKLIVSINLDLSNNIKKIITEKYKNNDVFIENFFIKR